MFRQRTSIAELLKENKIKGTCVFKDYCHRLSTRESVRHIATALEKNTSLTNLQFDSCYMYDEGIAILLPSLQKNTNIKVLNLTENYVGPTTVFNLLSGGTFFVLTRIDLCHNQLNDVGAQLLADYLEKNGALRELALDGNRIGEGASYLAEVMVTQKNTTLRQLSLSFNLIDDVVAQLLANALSVNTSLQSLDLSYNNMQAGVQSLVDVAVNNNFSLVLLNLFGNYGLDKETQAAIDAATERNRRLDWKIIHPMIVDVVIAMSPLELPAYVLLWIVDQFDHSIEVGVRHFRKISLIVSVIESIRRVRQKTGH